MTRRIAARLRELRSWLASVRTPLDWPAVVLLVWFRTRPPVGDGLAARAARTLWPRLWVRPRALGGLRVGLDPTAIAQYVIYEEVFVDGVYDLRRLGFTPDTVLDCGAFEGYFSLLARARFPKATIVAFEPDERNFDGLMLNARDAAVRIDARPAAVSTADGRAGFIGSGCGGRLGSDGDDRREVAVRDLGAIVAETRSSRLLLKLDIEGEEARVLPAILPVLPRTCAVFFEWHFSRAAFDKMAVLLAAAGFQAALLRERELDGESFIDAFAQRL